MTDSAGWIDTEDDAELKAFITERSGWDVKLADKPFLFGPAPRPYWITLVQEWAALNGLPVEHTSHIEIRVRVSKQQVLAFLEWAYGTPPSPTGFATTRLRDDRTYYLYADEF